MHVCVCFHFLLLLQLVCCIFRAHLWALHEFKTTFRKIDDDDIHTTYKKKNERNTLYTALKTHCNRLRIAEFFSI